MRPLRSGEVAGQEEILGPGTLLDTALKTGHIPSVVLWGPPGSGKTTIARLLARASGGTFESLSAVTSGVADVRAVIARAKAHPLGPATVLFVDEIHRFNRAQQDAFLPFVEDGTIVLLGATTENPGFSLIGALLSRLRVVVLQPLAPAALEVVLDRALADRERGLAVEVELEDSARRALLEVAEGDARRLLNVLEGAALLAQDSGRRRLRHADVAQAAQRLLRAHDRAGDDRYDLLSAFHKSLRGSDVDAALFYMARLLEAEEDPRVVARRLLAMASEDVGLADPKALHLALLAWEAVARLGLPECALHLTEAVIYVALAPKSNSVYLALEAAREAARRHGSHPVPLHLRQAPTPLAKHLGHGKGYEYPHDLPGAFSSQTYLPEGLEGLRLYAPNPVGDEQEVAERLRLWRTRRESSRPSDKE